MKLILVSTIVILCQFCFGQTTSIPRVQIKNNPEIKNLNIEEVAIHVVVYENLATTTMEMKFYNPLNRVLEGELEFPLAEGLTFSRFAMDIEGIMREGVVVEKTKGTQVFEEIVNRRVDPGLLEMTEGNNFRSRVYPIPAKGYKSIIVGYEQSLPMYEKSYKYLLPLDFNENIGRLKITVEVMNSDVSPVLDPDGIINTRFDKINDVYVCKFEQENFPANRQLGFLVPTLGEKNNILSYRGEKSNDEFFYLNVTVPQEHKVKSKPNAISIFWDHSQSVTTADIEKRMEFLDKYFNWVGSVSVSLVGFSIKPDAQQNFTIKNGNWDALKKHLQSLTYDGGTQLGVLDFSENKSDEILLFTDGLSNIGNNAVKYSNTPVTCVNSNLKANHDYLKHIAFETGGDYINLSRISLAELDKVIHEQSIRLISKNYHRGKMEEIYAEHFPGTNEWTVSGKLKEKAANIELVFGYSASEIVRRRNITITQSKKNNDILERIWAQMKLNELNINYEANEEEITRIGKKYSIVTKNTSLIVLETLSDYLNYEIVPPKEMQKEYFASLENQNNEKKTESISNIERIVNAYQSKITWWNQTWTWDNLPENLNNNSNQNSTNIGVPVYSTETKRITGVVYAADDGFIIAGVTVMLKGTNIGTVTNVEGKFELIVPVNAVLRFSFVGLVSQDVDASNADEISVRLETADVEVNELVVGAVSTTVTNESMVSVPDENQISIVEDDVEIESEFLIIEDSETSINSYEVDIAKIKEEDGEKKRESRKEISLTFWNPDTPYLKEIEMDKKNAYRIYNEYKAEYAMSPSFYLDCSDFFIRNSDSTRALTVLSNLAEINLQNHEILRILGRKLMHLNQPQLAVDVFKKVLEIRPFEPHSYRDLGLALATAGKHQEAIETLYKVVSEKWNSNMEAKFHGIEIIVVGEINSIIAKSNQKLETGFIDNRLLQNLPVDIRIVVDWDADNTDMDLWVTDPRNEKCMYSHNRTAIGGYMSRDITQGYGPEEFLLKKAIDGKYLVEVNYFGSTRQSISGPVTIQLQMITGFGTKDEQTKPITVRLNEAKGTIYLGNLIIE